MRQNLTSLRNSDPEKFVLAVGFSDPSFMSLSDLRRSVATSNNLLQGDQSTPNKIQIPVRGLYVNDMGHEIYRSENGREIDVTDVKKLCAYTRDTLVPSLNKEAGDVKTAFNELSGMVKEEQVSMKDRRSLALQQEPGMTGSIKRFFLGASQNLSPVGKDSFSGLKDGLDVFDRRVQSQQKNLNNAVVATQEALQKGDYEGAADHMAKAFEDAITTKVVYADAAHGLSTIKESFDQLDDAQKYTSGHADPVAPSKLSQDDLARISNPFFASDPDVQKVQHATLEEAPKGVQAVGFLSDLGVLDKGSTDRLQFQLVSKQKDVIRGFANLDKVSSSRVISAVQLADVTEDVIGGVVLGATMKKESGLSVAAGTAVYFTPLGPLAIARDLVAEVFKGRLSEDLRGAIYGSYLPEEKASPSSLRGVMLGYVASMGLSAARDVSHAVGTLAESKLSDGKMELALAALPFFFHGGGKAAEGAFNSLSDYRQLSTFSRVELNEGKLAALREVVSDLTAKGGDSAIVAKLQKKIDAVDGLINKLKERTIADLPNIASDFKVVRRPGLPERSLYESWIKGQFKDEEWSAMRAYSMKIGKDIPICGSLAETDLGMSRRYELFSKPELKEQLVQNYGIADYRARKPDSKLIDFKKGKGDVDIWAGSTLTKGEKEYILKNIFPDMRRTIDEGYSLKHYPTLGSLGGNAGALIFKADGTIERLSSNWQKEFLR